MSLATRDAQRFVFVVGPPRCGSTLLQSILAAHSQIESLPETHYFEYVLPRLAVESRRPDSPFPAIGWRFVKEALGKAGFSLELTDLPGDSAELTCREAFMSILAHFAGSNARIVVEKTPGHAKHIDEIRSFHPNAKFIGIVRHPVESVSSMRAMRPVRVDDYRLKYINPLADLTRHWARHADGLLAHAGEDYLLIIRYEDLIEDPTNVVQKVCNYLNIDSEVNMLLSFGRAAERLVTESVSPWKRQNLSSSLHDNRMKWRNVTNRGDVWLIEQSLNQYMPEFGYERAIRPSSMAIGGARLRDIARLYMRRHGLERRVRALLSSRLSL